MLFIDAQEQPITTVFNNTNQLSQDTAMMMLGMAATATLHVSPNGNNLDGSSWDKAFQNLSEALDAASTNTDDLTLISISPHTTNYDIDTTGDPTWAANVLLKGSYRNWSKIKNTHAGATSILKLTGKSCCCDLNFNLHTGSANGLIMTHSAPVAERCMFVGEDLTGAATGLHLDGATTIKHGRIVGCRFIGHATHMTGLLLDNAASNMFFENYLHDCLTAIQIIHADSDHNTFSRIDIGDCALGLDLDAGNGQHWHHIDFHGNTRNVDDEVGDHHWQLIHGHFPLSTLPDDFTGVVLTAGVGANAWGTDTEVFSAASRDNPFRVIGISAELSAGEKYRIRLSADSGTTFFADFPVEEAAAVAGRQAITLPAGTEEIFNKGTRISGSAKSESGSNTAAIWPQIQVI